MNLVRQFIGQPDVRYSLSLSRALAVVCALVFALFFNNTTYAEDSYVQDSNEADKTANPSIPHAGKKAHEHYLQYRGSAEHKAFAIAPGGAWYWLTEAVSEEQAELQAIKNCQESTEQNVCCMR